jgi:membrane protease YdiL (CAAX protease family)
LQISLVTDIESFSLLGRTGKSAWWRYFLGLFIVASGFLILGYLAYALCLTISGATVLLSGKMPTEAAGWQKISVDPLTCYLALFPSFVIVILLLWFVVHFLHRRSFLSLVTSRKWIDWRYAFMGFVIWGALLFLGASIEYLLYPRDFAFTFHAQEFIKWAPVILLLTPFQALAEEMFCCGYLMQFFGLWIQKAWVLSFLNGTIFLLLHLDHPVMTHSAATACLFYFCSGFLSAMLALRTNGLEMSVGCHAANNTICLLIFSGPDSLFSNPAIFTVNQRHDTFDVIDTLVKMIASYALLMLYFRRRGKQLAM